MQLEEGPPWDRPCQGVAGFHRAGGLQQSRSSAVQAGRGCSAPAICLLVRRDRPLGVGGPNGSSKDELGMCWLSLRHGVHLPPPNRPHPRGPENLPVLPRDSVQGKERGWLFPFPHHTSQRVPPSHCSQTTAGSFPEI